MHVRNGKAIYSTVQYPLGILSDNLSTYVMSLCQTSCTSNIHKVQYTWLGHCLYSNIHEYGLFLGLFSRYNASEGQDGPGQGYRADQPGEFSPPIHNLIILAALESSGIKPDILECVNDRSAHQPDRLECAPGGNVHQSLRQQSSWALGLGHSLTIRIHHLMKAME